MTERALPPQRGLWPWLVLPVRLVLFAVFQAAFAVALGSWDDSIAWWPIAAALTNLAVIGLLISLYRREGKPFWSIFRLDPAELRTGWLVLVAVIAGIVGLAIVPSVWLGGQLFGDAQIPQAMLIRPLPLWAAAAAIAFPLSVVVAELPLYFAYAMPRLEAQTRSSWVAIGIPALFLAAQHMTLPLILDGRFLLWRGLTFLPLALFLGVVLRARPKLLPVLVLVHGVLDLSAVVVLFTRLG